MVVALAGRCAEKLLLGENQVSTAGAKDLEQVGGRASGRAGACQTRWVCLFLGLRFRRWFSAPAPRAWSRGGGWVVVTSFCAKNSTYIIRN